jgi:hypothetical protein
MNRYLVVACEYSQPIGATPCDTEEEAEEIAEEEYNPYRSHSQGSVVRLMWWEEGQRWDNPVSLHNDDRPEPDDGP